MGRVPNKDRKTPQLRHLTDQHLEMIRRSVAGQRVGKIASEMGLHRTTVSRVLNSRLGESSGNVSTRRWTAWWPKRGRYCPLCGLCRGSWGNRT